MPDTLIIDGDYLEGGGQILRTAAALSLLTRRKIKIYDIRKRRPKPGLRPQHLAILNALVDISKAKISGLNIDSQEIEFSPVDFIKVKSLVEIDTRTAAAIGLILQPLILVAAFLTGGISLRIYGGTSVLGSMPVEYYENVIFPTLRRVGLKAQLKIIRYGFYPKGGGLVSADIGALDGPRPLIKEEQGKIRYIQGLSVASKELVENKVAQRQADAALEHLKQKFSCPIGIEKLYVDTESTGSQISLFAYTSKDVRLGADCRGEKGKSAESVGLDAASALEQEIKSGAAVDRHMADNAIPWLALLGGSILTSELTDHAKTNIWVCEQFFGKIFEIQDNSVKVQDAQIKRGLI